MIIPVHLHFISMKKQNWFLWVGLGIAAWYFLRKKAAPGTMISTLLPGGSAAREAASDAKQIVADVVDKTTFLPDLRTDADLYKEDQKYCK